MTEGKRLSDFKGKGKELLINFPLYKKIKIEIQIEEKEEREEIWSGNEESGPTIYNHTSFYENSDFFYLKYLLTSEMNIYCYCPVCHKELIYTSKPIERLPEDLKSDLLDRDTNISSIEQYEACAEFAKDKFKNRLEYVINNLLDINRNFLIELVCTANKGKRQTHSTWQ